MIILFSQVHTHHASFQALRGLIDSSNDIRNEQSARLDVNAAKNRYPSILPGGYACILVELVYINMVSDIDLCYALQYIIRRMLDIL